MLVIRVGTHKILVTFINKEDPDQNASSEAVLSESALIDVCVILDTTWASTWDLVFIAYEDHKKVVITN